MMTSLMSLPPILVALTSQQYGHHNNAQTIFHHILETYTIKLLSSWSQFSNDKEFLDRLYSRMFSKLYYIMTRLSKQFPFRGHEPDKRTSGGWLPEPSIDLDSFSEAHKWLHEHSLDTKEFDALMGTIWRISADVVPTYDGGKRAYVTVGWKEALEDLSRYA
jgi:hypothetical protein